MLQLKGKCQDGFFKEIDKYFIRKPIPKATAGNVFSSKLDKVPVGMTVALGSDHANILILCDQKALRNGLFWSLKRQFCPQNYAFKQKNTGIEGTWALTASPFETKVVDSAKTY